MTKPSGWNTPSRRNLRRNWRKNWSAANCPHGNPVVPERSEARRRRGLRLLSEAEPGTSYLVSSVYERDSALLRFLDERGVRPGAQVRVLEGVMTRP